MDHELKSLTDAIALLHCACADLEAHRAAIKADLRGLTRLELSGACFAILGKVARVEAYLETIRAHRAQSAIYLNVDEEMVS